ncbi:sugar phosphate isomerase/epimerase family protein [Onishia niordana]|uniref:sugar phosphate isomerase/epimerase family protein n=1 Tax=Onishia niordana TaxID=2508711 RepID=UPI001F10A243|nr:sugar phosphate isomerase/epimerase [Halomonas niordiana]
MTTRSPTPRASMVPFPSHLSASPDSAAVLVATSAFGHSLIAEHGQAAVLPWLKEAGADGVEIRRELLPDGFDDFEALGRAGADASLGVVYSAADALWHGDSLAPGVMTRLEESRRLGALAVKFSLGHYASDASPASRATAWQQLCEALNGTATPLLLIENDQTAEGGTLAPMAAILADAKAAGCPLYMTFDIGNWQWTGVDPLAAAQALGPYVRYLHCKGVSVERDRLHASVPDDRELAEWRALLAHFPAGVTRAIEYPLQGSPLVDVTREQFNRLRPL